MKIHTSLLLFAVILLGGCATMASRDAISTAGRIAVVTAFSPTMRGHNVGTTVFQNKDFLWNDTGFDPNAVGAEIVRAALTREARVIDGATIGLVPHVDEKEKNSIQTLSPKLTALGKEWGVDLILLLHEGTATDSIAGTNQSLKGIGYYRREVFGMKRHQVYGVFELSTFDCSKGQLVGVEQLLGARETPSIVWHDGWSGYSFKEKRILTTGWHEMLKENIPLLLTKVGLADAKVPERSFVDVLIYRPNKPRSWLPEGNTLEIPEGVSKTRAHLAVINGLHDRGWSIVSDSEERIVGVYCDDEKEAGVTATITERTIVLTPEAHEIRTDGRRVAVKPFTRWDRNLKESIFDDLMNAEPDRSKPE